MCVSAMYNDTIKTHLVSFVCLAMHVLYENYLKHGVHEVIHIT